MTIHELEVKTEQQLIHELDIIMNELELHHLCRDNKEHEIKSK